MKEFSNPRELISQIGLDLESKSGMISKSFRINIRNELNSFDKKTTNVSIKQTSFGSVISLHLEDWVDGLERKEIIDKFKDLMDRIGATTTNICNGTISGSLAIFLKSI
jgi:hypothetical protein